MKKLFCLICVLIFVGCSTKPKSNPQSLDENLDFNYLLCIGALEANLHTTYEQTGSFPSSLEKYQDVLYEINSNCKLNQQIQYRLIDNKTYLLRYAREDAQFNDNDYYFYPNYERTGRLGYPERKQESKEQGHEAHIDYCTGYIGGRVEQFWKVFGYYPDNIHKLNHPYMDEIYFDCISKEKIIYIRENPQNYILQLPGYDSELNTHDDYFIRPIYGKGKLDIKLKINAGNNQG